MWSMKEALQYSISQSVKLYLYIMNMQHKVLKAAEFYKTGTPTYTHIHTHPLFVHFYLINRTFF